MLLRESDTLRLSNGLINESYRNYLKQFKYDLLISIALKSLSVSLVLIEISICTSFNLNFYDRKDENRQRPRKLFYVSTKDIVKVLRMVSENTDNRSHNKLAITLWKIEGN